MFCFHQNLKDCCGLTNFGQIYFILVIQTRSNRVYGLTNPYNTRI